MILLMKCLLSPDCSRAGAVPATQQTSPDPALFSAPGPTHYREYIYYYMTTPHQPSQEAQDFGRSVPDPYTLRERGLGARLHVKLLYLEVHSQPCLQLGKKSSSSGSLHLCQGVLYWWGYPGLSGSLSFSLLPLQEMLSYYNEMQRYSPEI